MKFLPDFSKKRSIFTYFFSIVIGMTSVALSEEAYIFDRMWPTLQQPWYFNVPTGLAVDLSGNIYVADSGNDSIKKFAKDGQLITKWGSYTGLRYPRGIAIDLDGNIYVCDYINNRVQKFTIHGQLIMTFGQLGSGDGDFDGPADIVVDTEGNIYVAEDGNNRIQKFTSEGAYITKWGSLGEGAGEFHFLQTTWFYGALGLTIDANDYLYVADTGNNRIQKFTTDGAFVEEWGSKGSDDGQFNEPTGLAIDSSGHIYVADTKNYRVQKFNSNGEYITKWGNLGGGNAEFRAVVGIVADNNGYIYVNDASNHSIQKFTSDGIFMTKWSNAGIDEGYFNQPLDITLDNSDNVYVADYSNGRIQKFTSNGQISNVFNKQTNAIAIDDIGNIYCTYSDSIIKLAPDGQVITEWGSSGTGNGQFNIPQGIAIDNGGNVYVADGDNYRIQKFTSDGEFITKWGSIGSGDGQFGISCDGRCPGPTSLAVDDNGNVYAADPYNNRVQVFTSDGEFIAKWDGDGQLSWPWGIAVDNNGYVLIANTGDHTIQKYSSEGIFLSKYGSLGSEPGQTNNPFALAVNTNDYIYVADTYNNRIQTFKLISSSVDNKAIIVSGGGSFPGNNLWNATQMNANFAYRTLNYQGFLKNNIYYLSSDTDIDLDQNGEADDVDADATNANLENAILNWASDADNVVVYLVDHGGDGTFRMSGTETLSASDLDAWLDQVQETAQSNVIVVYDACESGSFMSQLTPPSEKERIVIGSTSPGESAYFVTQGSISFSSFFWTHVFNGLSIKEAFDLASQSITNAVEKQHPMLDDDGDGVGNGQDDGILSSTTNIGNGTVISGEVPVIGGVGSITSDDANSFSLYAEGVTDVDDIARVWAVIRPPNYQQGTSYNPVYELPSVDLMPTDVENRWEATYSNFDIPGTYYIAVYARDRVGNTSVPSITTVSVDNPLSRKALIIAAGNESDQLWPAVKENSYLAYNILKFQGYTEDNIYLMSDNIISDAEVDDSATISNLESVLSGWAVTDTNDLVIYMIGKSNKREFWMNQTEKIAPDELDILLDIAQESIPGMLTVIYDGEYSGSFITDLTPPDDKTRIVIASAESDQSVHFITDGDLSFSRFFWGRVLNGTNVRDSFIYAKTAMAYLADQTPVLDDNGNGIGNEKADGIEARNYSIGIGIMLAGDAPIIGEVSPVQTVEEGGTASIWASNITTTGSIREVWSVITPPTGEITTVQLTDDGTGKYEGSFNGFYYYGDYSIVLYAEDQEGNISFPESTTINYEPGPESDFDDDGLLDDLEFMLGTSPYTSDTDNDGLNDVDEDANRNGTVDSDETDPTNSDTDGDRMDDGWEVYYDLDPLFNDADEDADEDGFKNIMEYEKGTDPLDAQSHPSKGLPWLMLLLEDG